MTTLKEVKKEANALEQRPEKKCMVCGSKAVFCMRGLPKNSYCKDCAEDHFKFLNYLEKLK
ncbi:MAG: hypothetical protein ABIE94_06940 [archaeon]